MKTHLLIKNLFFGSLLACLSVISNTLAAQLTVSEIDENELGSIIHGAEFIHVQNEASIVVVSDDDTVVKKIVLTSAKADVKKKLAQPKPIQRKRKHVKKATPTAPVSSEILSIPPGSHAISQSFRQAQVFLPIEPHTLRFIIAWAFCFLSAVFLFSSDIRVRKAIQTCLQQILSGHLLCRPPPIHSTFRFQFN